MNIDDLDHVTPLRNQRRNCIALLGTIQHGMFDVKLGPDEISISCQINIMPIRDFVARELLSHIHTLEVRLRALGVTVKETEL